jgi:hypothetical protein
MTGFSLTLHSEGQLFDVHSGRGPGPFRRRGRCDGFDLRGQRHRNRVNDGETDASRGYEGAVILAGGALAMNIYWQVAGNVKLMEGPRRTHGGHPFGQDRRGSSKNPYDISRRAK